MFENRKIWLTKTGLTIYEPLDFFGKSSFTVKGTAVFEMDKLVKELLKTKYSDITEEQFLSSRDTIERYLKDDFLNEYIKKNKK